MIAAILEPRGVFALPYNKGCGCRPLLGRCGTTLSCYHQQQASALGFAQIARSAWSRMQALLPK